jgi:nicotinamidase-related amidase
MTSEPIRDPRADHLLTPQNCALVIIDYQPVQVSSIRSMDQDVLVDRVVHLARFGMLYRLPVVLSTVNVSTGRNQPTIAPLQDACRGSWPWTGRRSTPGKTPSSSRRSGRPAGAS